MENLLGYGNVTSNPSRFLNLDLEQFLNTVSKRLIAVSCVSRDFIEWNVTVPISFQKVLFRIICSFDIVCSVICIIRGEAGSLKFSNNFYINQKLEILRSTKK